MSFTRPSLSSRAMRTLGVTIAVVALSFALHAMPVSADESATTATPPVNAAAVPGAATGSPASLPMGAFFDPTRMSFHQSLEFGASTGGAYRGTAGLYTASFGYRLANPLQMHLDLGAGYAPQVNSGYGAASYNPGFSGLFVKNFSLDWRPGANSLVRFSYQDRRSPLQWGPYDGSYYNPYNASPFADPSTFGEPPSRN